MRPRLRAGRTGFSFIPPTLPRFPRLLLAAALLAAPGLACAQLAPAAKPISPDLFGIFFEDISYAADGGLYGELVQNRSFGYAPSDHEGWHPLTSWQYLHKGCAVGSASVESTAPVHPNNPHYVELQVENPFRKGLGLRNAGFDGILVKAGEAYDFSLWARLKADQGWALANQLRVPLVDEHYYEKPRWFLTDNHRYCRYDRRHSKVCLGGGTRWARIGGAWPAWPALGLQVIPA